MAHCITPRPGLVVRDPRTMRPLPETGLTLREKPGPHWLRRQTAGDVTITTVPDAAASSVPSAPQED